LYGCYENISGPGCSTTRALQDLTGGIVQSFGLSNQDRFLTYQVLNSAVPRSSLLISTITLVSVKPVLFSRTASLWFPYDVYNPSCVAEGEQETTEAAERSNDSARVQRHGFGTSPRSFGRYPAGEAEKSLGWRRVDRSLEREELGMGRPVRQRQGAAQCQGSERRRILVRSYGVKVKKYKWPTRPEEVTLDKTGVFSRLNWKHLVWK